MMKTSTLSGIRSGGAKGSVALATFALLASTGFQPALAQTYTITDLGTLGGTNSQGFGINNFGQVVGTSSGNVFLWTPTSPNAQAGILTGIGPRSQDPVLGVPLGGVAINASGQVVVDSAVWTPSNPNGSNGTISSLRNPNAPGRDCSFFGGTGSAINDVGTVVGFAWKQCSCPDACGVGQLPVVWDGHPRALDTCGNATALNDAGQIAVASGAFCGLGQLWQKDGTSVLLPMSYPVSINSFGQVVGNRGLWTPASPNGTNGTLTDLGSPALGINTSGHFVGTYLTTNNHYHAFLWSPASPNGTNGTMKDLNTLIPAGAGWELTEARGINDQRQIVGTGINPAGQTHAVLLTLSAQLISPTRQTGGQFRFTLLGEAGRSYTIQASTNLLNWMAVTNFVSTTGTNQFTDSAAPSLSRRFYRAVTP